ncbi:MAG: glycosyltransferase [bacterium]
MPMLSLVIPTRNRQSCAEFAIRVALEECHDVQVVVSDNSDTNELRGRICDLAEDPRVIYIYTPELMSVVENFERALQFAIGEYVMFLGDDDTVGPEIMRIVKWAQRLGIETVNYKHQGTVLHYFWPGVRSQRWGKALAGSLVLSRFTGTTQMVDHHSDIEEALSDLGAGPMSLPRVYLGIVARSLLARVRAKYGSVFGGVSPDIFSSHLIAEESRSSAVVDFPFVIPGAFSASTSAQRAARTDVGSIRSTEHIQRFKQLDWDPMVPCFYSPYTVWAFTHLAAVALTPRYSKSISFESLYAKCLLRSPGHVRETMAAWKVWAQDVGVLSALGKVMRQLVLEISTTVVRLMKTLLRGKPGGAAFQYGGIPDTRGALRMMERHLCSRRVELKLSEENFLGRA